MTSRAEITQEPRSVRQKAARWLRPLMVAALILRCANAFAAPGNDGDRKFDRQLRRNVHRGAESQKVKVILTLRPGARRGLLMRLAAQGVKITDNYSLTEAMVANLPKGMVRRLADDRDVVSISTSTLASDNLSGSTVTEPLSFLNPPVCLPSGLLPTNSIVVFAPESAYFVSAASAKSDAMKPAKAIPRMQRMKILRDAQRPPVCNGSRRAARPCL